MDGVIVDDIRRLADDCPNCSDAYDPPNGLFGTFEDPDCDNKNTNYTWEALQGITMSAHLLTRMGLQSFAWQNSAVKRAHEWLYNVAMFPPEESCDAEVPGCDTCDHMLAGDSDDTWVPHIVNAHNDTIFSVQYGKDPGKNCGFADWWTMGIP